MIEILEIVAIASSVSIFMGLPLGRVLREFDQTPKPNDSVIKRREQKRIEKTRSRKTISSDTTKWTVN
jgi:hypothetical protein